MRLPSCLRPLLAVLIAYSCVGGLSADSLKDDTSLRFVPASASFFVTSFHLREQWQAFANSKAYARILELPLVQMGIQQTMSEWDDSDEEPVAELRAFIRSPENQDLVNLACDAFSHEIFMYGDENLGKALGKLNEVNRQVSSLQWRMIGDSDADEDEMKREIVGQLIDSVDDLDVPQFTLGFRTSMRQVARQELGRLKQIVMAAAEQEEELEGRITESTTDRSDLLVLQLDSSMIPWDEAIEEEPDMAEQIRRVRDKLEDRQLTFAVGVVDDYIVLVMTPDSDVTASFESKDLLVESPVLERLRKYEDRRIVSIGYVSDAFAKAVSDPKKDIEQLSLMLNGVLPMLDVDDDMRDRVSEDTDQFVSDVQAYLPTPGAMVSFSFLTDSGYEGYIENWSENLFLNGSETLDVLNYVGGDPIAMVARNYRTHDPEVLRRWMVKVWQYVEQLVLENELEEEQWDLYTQFRDGLSPVLEEYQETTDNHWRKAFTSGQSAFVMDSKLDEKPMWHFLMPPSREPLPMMEFAWVYPLSNRFEFEQALEGYQSASENLLKTLKGLTKENEEMLTDLLEGPGQMVPGLIQSAQIPQPQEREVDDGKILYSLMLQRGGVDPAIAPNMGWNSSVFAVSLSPDTTERMLESKMIEGPLAKAEGKKLAAATYVNMQRLFGFLRPWVAYGMTQAKSHGPEEMIEQIAPQVDTMLEVMQCYRRYYSITLQGDDSLVTHFRSDFQDLDE